MIGPTDLLHPSPVPHFETLQVFMIYRSCTLINLLTTLNTTFIQRPVLTQIFERFSSLLTALQGPLAFRQEPAASHSIWPDESNSTALRFVCIIQICV
jgi:hypothetical protein